MGSAAAGTDLAGHAGGTDTTGLGMALLGSAGFGLDERDWNGLGWVGPGWAGLGSARMGFVGMYLLNWARLGWARFGSASLDWVRLHLGRVKISN